ncbi:MAG TPA: flagellar hook-associated protein FlgL [Candidatus Angelobacter sp.]|nr:flagellar hook-associated protein FlgL [Candidatus Angelobacter sp.]
MRVNPNTSNDLLQALARTEKQAETALLQVSSGRSVNKPSDDPTAAAVLVGNHARADQTDQYLRSITSIQGELRTADATLNSVVTTLQRAISLGVQGANGTLSDANRNSLADDLTGIQAQLVGIANLSFQGRFVFAGTNSKTTPFVLDATQPSGVRYDGNAGVNLMAVDESFQLQVNVPGSQLFSDPAAPVFQAIQDLITSLQNNTGIDAAVAGVRAAFDHVTTQRVFYGNALNQLESQQTFLGSVKLQLAAEEDKVGGTDLAAALSRLSDAENARTATLQAAGQIARVNLFDFLK